MAKKKSYSLFVEVLQNGVRVCFHKTSLQRNASLSITNKGNSSLSLPLYPLSGDIELLTVEHGLVLLHLNEAYSGLIVTGKEKVTLDGSLKSFTSHVLEKDDYASLYWKDLSFLIKVAVEPVVVQHKIDWSLRSWPIFPFIKSKNEWAALLVASLVSVMLFSSFLYSLLSQDGARPQKLEELEERYVLPFMSKEGIETSPEALKNKLNRDLYLSSIIGYYRSFTAMNMGFVASTPRKNSNNDHNANNSYMYPSSVQLYENLYVEQAFALNKLVEEQNVADKQVLADDRRSSFIIPTVYGESFQLRILKLIQKIDLAQNNFQAVLKKRRDITKTFKEDPEYDWQKYKDVSAKSGSDKDKLSKIRVFDDLSDELTMYKEALDLGIRAQDIRLKQDRRREDQQWLASDNYTPVILSVDKESLSFNYEKILNQNDSKIEHMQASYIETRKNRKTKEPLIGKIDPSSIERFVKTNRYQLNLCYELALKRNQKIAGYMEWSWMINSKGHVIDLSLVDSSIEDPSLISCIKRHLSSWNFPKPKLGSVLVNHTFKFEPELSRNG